VAYFQSAVYQILNSPDFRRHSRVRFPAASRTRRATALRFWRVCVLDFRTSRCDRTHPGELHHV